VHSVARACRMNSCMRACVGACVPTGSLTATYSEVDFATRVSIFLSLSMDLPFPPHRSRRCVRLSPKTHRFLAALL